MTTVKSHSLGRGLASVGGASLDGNIVDGRACSSGESQTDGRPSSTAMIRSAGAECVRDRMMNLKQKQIESLSIVHESKLHHYKKIKYSPCKKSIFNLAT